MFLYEDPLGHEPQVVTHIDTHYNNTLSAPLFLHMGTDVGTCRPLS